MATKIISKEEAASLRMMPFGKKHPVRQLIEDLKPGELLQVDRQDFSWRRKTPNFFCLQIARKRKRRFKVMKLSDGGWVVERLK